MAAENPFQFLEQLAPQEVADRLSGEMAFVQGAALCKMSPVMSAKVMACMENERRREVAAAMSKSRQMPSDVLADIADELRKKVRPAASGGFSGLAKLKNLQLRPLAGVPDAAGGASSQQGGGAFLPYWSATGRVHHSSAGKKIHRSARGGAGGRCGGCGSRAPATGDGGHTKPLAGDEKARARAGTRQQGWRGNSEKKRKGATD